MVSNRTPFPMLLGRPLGIPCMSDGPGTTYLNLLVSKRQMFMANEFAGAFFSRHFGASYPVISTYFLNSFTVYHNIMMRSIEISRDIC